MIKLLIDGGLIFTLPMTIIFMVNLVLIARGGVFILKEKFKNQQEARRWIDAVKYIAILLLTLGILGQIVGLYSAFEVIGEKKILLDPIILIQGIRVSSITTLLGLTYFTISYIAWLLMIWKLNGKFNYTS